MYKIEELQKIVSQEIDKVIYGKKSNPRQLYEPIEYILSIGGKRLRPALTLMACNLFSRNVEYAIPAALALETFHNFTLLHDDIMDNSPMRRNQPTVHTKWNESVAILSGDAMMIKAYQYLAESSKDKLSDILDVFSQTAIEVCEGQQYDMEFETRNNVKIEEYMEMIRLKTSVLIAACLKIGAIVGGANSEDAQNLYDFGVNIGLAFQLQDDYLDIYGDSKVFGKPIGGDIVCNKKTFFLINALEMSKGEKREKLLDLLNKKDIEENIKIYRVTELYNQLSLAEKAKGEIEKFYDTAIKSLEKVSVGENKKEELKKFAKKLMNRDK